MIFKKFAMLILACWLFATSQAQENVKVVVMKTPTGFSLDIRNPQKKKLDLEISHNYLGTAVDTLIRKEVFVQSYNTAEAEDGTYTIVVRDGKEKYIHRFQISTVVTKKMELY